MFLNFFNELHVVRLHYIGFFIPSFFLKIDFFPENGKKYWVINSTRGVFLGQSREPGPSPMQIG